MGLDATALVDLATAKGFLVVVGTADDPAIEAAINAATLACENYCGRPLKERAVSERVEGIAGTRLYLRVAPLTVASAVAVTVDEVAQTVWKQESDGLQSDFDVIARPDHLFRRNTWRPAATDPYNVLLSYTGGFPAATMPAAIKEACLYVVQKLFRDSKRQLAELATVSGPFGSVSIIDNAMPRVATMLLAPYRFVSVA